VPGRVELLIPLRQQVAVIELGPQLRLHAVSILEHTLLAALDGEVRSGAQRVDTLSTVGGPSATLAIDDVRFGIRQRLLWYVPVSLTAGITKLETSATLTIDLSLFDAQGRPVWTRTYQDDTGRLTWTSPSTSRESVPEGLTRLAHEAGSGLSRQAARDVRDWLEAERGEPRRL
jgi:hypothetical protein